MWEIVYTKQAKKTPKNCLLPVFVPKRRRIYCSSSLWLRIKQSQNFDFKSVPKPAFGERELSKNLLIISDQQAFFNFGMDSYYMLPATAMMSRTVMQPSSSMS